MTEEEKNEQQEESPQASVPSPQEEGADAPAEEPGAAEAPAEEEQAAEEAPEPSAQSPEPAAESDEAEEDEPLSPRERRKRERSVHSGEARTQRSPEERAHERAEQRRRKASRRRAWRARSRVLSTVAPATEPTPHTPRSTGKPKLRQGVVVSDRADKTITVRIDSQRAHRMYGKVVRTSSTLHAHDEGNDAHVGDTVRVIESRPLSRTKRWRLVEILERAR
jgi:small subunit ribosomal protein S17